MTDSRLTRRLEVVAGRLRRLRRLKRLSAAWAVAALVCLGLLAAGIGGVNVWTACLLGLAALAIGFWTTRRRASDLQTSAAEVEQAFPDLDAALWTAAAQRPDPETQKYGFLQEQVFSEVLLHAYRNDWSRAVPLSRLFRWRLVHLASFALFLAAAVFAVRHSPAAPDAIADADATDSVVPSRYAVTVIPGDTEVERGRSLLVQAEFETRLPADVELVAVDAQRQSVRIPLVKSLSDPVFGGWIASVDSDLVYHVEYAGERSPDYKVTTFVYPELVRADAKVIEPAYTGRGELVFEKVRRISIVEGSRLTLTCRLNKPVATAVLESESGAPIELAPEADPSIGDEASADFTVAASWTPGLSQSLRLILTDEDGRQNREPPEFEITVVPNEPPELAVEFPARDTQVSPIEELSLEASAWDDYGLTGYGLILNTTDGGEETLPLGESAPSEESVTLAHLLELETMQAEPRQLVSYYFYADDVGPDGRPRRTYSDIFFAEVRHFDEIYREMPSQQGQQGQQSGQAGQAGELVELQRQIVSAVWNVMRAWNPTRVELLEATYSEDVAAIAESQQVVVDMATELAAALEDLEAQQHAGDALEQMQAVINELELANRDSSVDPLPNARDAARSAYRSLLQLQARIHIVQQQQQQGGGGGSSNKNNDRQLDQLELQNDRNRYEQQRQPEQQQEANREQLQVLNRLRELAQRQEDINDRIQELENKLRDADDDEREELERELKRLQEEQEELLRDLDEVRERMERPENRRDMASARRELEETRENVLRSSEALQEGQTSKALSSGTRAERELEELREEFRRKTAGEFADVMQQMRDDARELAEREQEIADQLGSGDEPSERPTLRDTADREDLADALEEQRTDLGRLLDQMRDVVEQSELSEPLLSRHLYEAMRDARVDHPEEALEVASQLLRRGFPEQGVEAEAQARRGIERLQAGVEKAADSVLGDETEALRRAQDELAQLTESIENELAEGDPGQQPQPGSQPGESSASQSPSDETSEESESQPGRSPSGEESESSENSDSPQPGDEPEQSPGDQPGEQSGNQPGKQPRGQSGNQPGETPGRQPGGNQPGRQSPQDAQSPSESSESNSNRSPGSPFAPFLQGGNADGAGGGPQRPLTGGDFLEWSDRMRDIEEMIADPELRAEAAGIRERAREIRIDVKRHSEQPNWDLVRTSVYGPMLELRQLLAEEIARRTSEGNLVPIDRDPVPEEFSEQVRQYFEELGTVRDD